MGRIAPAASSTPCQRPGQGGHGLLPPPRSGSAGHGLGPRAQPQRARRAELLHRDHRAGRRDPVVGRGDDGPAQHIPCT